MDKLVYSDVPDHAVDTLRGLDDLRRNFPELCDFTLVIEEDEFPCHRSVLCLHSKYFRGMIGGKFIENHKNRSTVKDISSKTFTIILDYIYTGKIELNQSTVESILEVATRLEFEKVVNICVSYLRHQIDETNSIAMHAFAVTKGFTELAEAAKKFTYENLETIFENKEIVENMTPSELQDILQDELAHLHGEEQLISIILKWISLNPDKRRKHIQELLINVNWSLVSTKYILRSLFYHPLVTNEKSTKQFIVSKVRQVVDEVAFEDDSINKLTSNNSTSRNSPRSGEASQSTLNQRSVVINWHNSDRKRTRDDFLGRGKHGCLQEVLFLVGGLTLGEAERGDTTQPNVMCYDPRKHCWESRADWPERRLRGFSIANFHNDVIVTGGCDFKDMKRTNINRAWMYRSENDTWIRMPDMKRTRSFHSSCQINSELVAVGGAYTNKIDMEFFNPHSYTWRTVKEYAPKFVWNFAVATCNGKVLLIGSGENSQSLVLQCYNPSIAQWSQFRSPNVPRHLSAPLCSTTRDGNVLFVSGDNSQKMFLFNPNKNKWTRGRDMHDLHANGGMATVAGSVYLTGGHWEEDGYWDEMEAYDIENDVWSQRGALPHLWLYHTCTSIVISRHNSE